MPGDEQEAAGLLDSYLAAERARAEHAARAAAPVSSWVPGTPEGAARNMLAEERQRRRE